MRRCKMQRTHYSIILIAATCILCFTRVINCDDSRDNGKSASVEKTKTRENVVTDSNKDLKTDNNNNDNAPLITSKQQTGKNLTSKLPAENKTVTENISSQPEPGVGQHQPSLNSGALRRGFYVFVGLSILALAYIVFRSLRLNKNRPQMVRKYGILAHKQDIEMRPLPLDEDDEDDTTVFDASGLAPPRPQS